jgi:hypothetical protein
MRTNPILHSSAVLKLNACWQGLNYITPQEAFVKIFNERHESPLRALDVVLNGDGSISNHTRSYSGAEWIDLPVRPIDISIGLPHGRRVRAPLAVIVPNYNKIPRTTLQFSRRGLYVRDRGRCAYCGETIAFDDSTKDHVVPVSHNGPTSWTNCVLACVPCNAKKADRTPEEAGMPLLRKPTAPGVVPTMVVIQKDSPIEHRALLHVA